MSALLRRLPLRAAYGVAALCGSVAFACSPRLRRTTLHNFSHVLPGHSQRRLRKIARASVVNYCRYLVDFARASGKRPRIAACEPGDAFERLRCVTAARGAVIVPMHFGNWDAGAAAAVQRGFVLTAVADRFGDPRLDRDVFGAREHLGMRIVPVDHPGPAIARVLLKRGLLALLIDKPLPGDGVAVPFFGSEVHVPAGPARLALRTGAAIVPVAFPRLAPWSDTIGVLADFEIDTCATGDTEADVHRITAAVMAAHERFIRSFPDQWYQFREMWAGEGVHP